MFNYFTDEETEVWSYQGIDSYSNSLASSPKIICIYIVIIIYNPKRLWWLSLSHTDTCQPHIWLADEGARGSE